MPIFFQLHHQALPISIESIGNCWEQVYINRQEGYPYYHWLQTESGRGEIWIGQNKISLRVGEGILIAPFVPHTYFSTHNWYTKFVTFNGDFTPYLQDICQVKQFTISNDTKQFNYSKWIDTVILAHQKKETNPVSLSKEAYEFLLTFREINQYNQTNEHPLFKQFILPTIEEIETYFFQDLTVTRLAQKLFISPQYLNRLFNRFLDQSPYQYLTDFRINQAKERLINHPNTEIQQIAIDVGFSSSSQFSFLFKEKTSYTPKEFRKLFFSNNKNSSLPNNG